MQAKMPGRRKIERQKCVVEARAFFDRQPALRCSIEDITPQGAKLTGKEPIPAQANKTLIFIPAIGEVWAARICWRRDLSMGVEFISGEADFSGSENPPDADIFALRLQVAQIADTTKRLSAA